MSFAIVMMAISTAVSVVGAIQQGNAAKSAADYSAAVNRNNAIIAGQNAAIARDQASMEAKQTERQNYLRLGSIRASQGHAGGGQEGSVLDILGDQAAQGELDKQDVLYRGELAARSHLNQQGGALANAQLDTMKGKAAKTASYMKAGSTLLSGGGDIYTELQRL